jgi:hypothetical protein
VPVPAAPDERARSGATGSAAPPDEEALSTEQVQAQVAEAERLRAELMASDAELAAAMARLEALSAKATVALEQLRRAREQQAAANAETLRQLGRLTALQGQVESSEEELGRWARDAYTTGGPMASYQGLLTAMRGTSTGDVGHDLAVLEHLGVTGGIRLDRLEVATTSQRLAATRAATAARAAIKARQAADRAKASADAVLKDQLEALAQLKARQQATVGELATARQELIRTGSAAALVAEAELAAALRSRAASDPTAAGAALGATGLATPGTIRQKGLGPTDCVGADVSVFANGEIPAWAMCPLWGAAGHLLRADAAAAFRALSREYTMHFGSPICVTDSYRSRAGQVAVYAAKPHLAAIPGTSNHGLGTALDLCGGIQSFGTEQHAWMLAHAPLHGWFHPAWAGPRGSKPEPWHWEFAG